ncbi:hypothetical protein [Bacillus pinisoli]|uniref:hypothetical protein n=1 Tax=Bacillus pinisoli TaxID=2901866 RepID=UPI001FF50EA4|nr:hypothetical protein [Bacillus pinisoli]
MLRKDWNLYCLYIAITLFEIISFYLLTKVVTDAINPFELIFAYSTPLAILKWLQLGKSKVSQQVLLFIPILQVVLLSLFGYSLIILASLLLFSFWRVYTFIKESYPERQATWLAAVLATTFFVLMSKREFLMEHVSWFLLLLLLFFVIRVLLQVREHAWVLVKGSYQQLLLYMVGAALGLLLVFQVGMYVLKIILSFLATVIGYIIGFPISWMLEKLQLKAKQEEGEIDGIMDEPSEFPFKDVQTGMEGLQYDVVTTIIVLLIVVISLYFSYIAKKSVKDTDLEPEQLISVEEDHQNKSSFLQAFRNLRNSFYSDHGRNDVRLQFYKLQAYLKKRGYERKQEETVEEWFNRLQLDDETATEVLKIYERSRYSVTSLSDQEFQIYANGIKQIKNQFKEKSSTKKE